jgi:formylglycine-generating enzyme required for sulfatase activity
MLKTRAMAMLVLGMFFASVGGDSRESTAQAQAAGTRDGAAGAKELTLDLGNGVSMKLLQIPAGKFLMGSLETEKGRRDEDQHEVTISRPFYMEVSHVHWRNARKGKGYGWQC